MESKNQKGFSLLMAAIFVAFVVTVMAVFYPMMSRHLMKNKQLLSARAEIGVAETMIRFILGNPAAYECHTVGGVANCVFQSSSTSGIPTVKSPLVADVILAAANRLNCIPHQNCTITVKDGGTIAVVAGVRRATFEYSMDIQQVGFFHSSLDVPLPNVGLLNKMIPCQGILKGIAPDGSAICQNIDSRRAKIGDYISAIDPNTYTVTFSTVPAPVTDCVGTNDKFIMTYAWNGGPKYDITCHDRLDPKVFPP